MNISEMTAYVRQYVADANSAAEKFARRAAMRRRTWRHWLTSDMLFLGLLSREERLWNATRLRITVTDRSSFAGDAIPRRYRLAHHVDPCDASIYAVPPLHLILRAWHWWRRYRWSLERWGCGIGLFQLAAENKVFAAGRWRWPSDLPLGGRRRAPFEWSREKQLQHHPILWADDPPGGDLCS